MSIENGDVITASTIPCRDDSRIVPGEQYRIASPLVLTEWLLRYSITTTTTNTSLSIYTSPLPVHNNNQASTLITGQRTTVMRYKYLIIFLFTFIFFSTSLPAKEYETQEPWLAERISDWQDLKFGFFVHWGIYSQWGCIESWPLVEVDEWARPDDLPVWVERGRDIELFKRDYWKLNQTFNPTRFQPESWVKAAQDAGMKYFVFTTKHHDGFSMFDTRYTDFRSTSPDCPFHESANANATKVLFDAFRAEDFKIGAYFSKADWHSPYYWSPDSPARTRNPNYDTLAEPEKMGKNSWSLSTTRLKS